MTELIICFLALFSEGFFSGSEIAIVSSDDSKLLSLAKKNHKGAKKLLDLKKTPIKFLSVCLIGTNLFTATASFTGTLFILKNFPEYKNIGIVLMIPVLMTLGEIIPKTIYSKFPTAIALIVVYPIDFLARVLKPIIFLLDKWSGKIASFFKKEEELISKEEFLLMLESEKNCLPVHLRDIIDRFKQSKNVEYAIFGEQNAE